MTVIPAGAANAAICSNQTGSNGSGMYYQMWSNGQGSACINLSGSNSYSTNWSGVGDFVAGLGWQPGSNETVSFNGNVSAGGGTTLISLYGWSTNPLVEYYVIEDDQGGGPSLGSFMGTTTSDGATYNIYEHQQVNQPCITGNNCTFEQYLAIRQGNTTSGTITT
ncbi:glycoside hydrolase family 11 protein, partial [Actinocrinis puniceicyclus]|nr:glycoside hydrolase family 11 protein [Actinocrinis puniceicyclus]